MTGCRPILHYDNTRAALEYVVEVFGFAAAVAAKDPDGDVVHAELRWPGGGALVFGSTKHTDSVHGHLPSGVNAVYVATDDVDAIHDRVVAAGGDVVEPPHQTRFGSGAKPMSSLRVTTRATWGRSEPIEAAEPAGAT